MVEDTWKVVYKSYEPKEETLREALCALGNGYFTTRGAAEMSKAGRFHYPGTYLACGFNRLKTEIAGKWIENEDLVNWPDWTVLKFKHEDGDWIQLEDVDIIGYRQELDLQKGTLTRKIRFKDHKGRSTQLVTRRIVCMHNKNLAAIKWELTPINWSGNIIVHSGLDGSVINHGVERYKELNSKHLEVLDLGTMEESGIYLKVRSNQSEIVMAQTARTLFDGKSKKPLFREKEQEYIGEDFEIVGSEGKPIVIEKIVSIFTSRDNAITEPLLESKTLVSRTVSFDDLLEKHIADWKGIWKECDVKLEADNGEDQLVLRLHIFHIFQTYSYNTIGIDAGVPARGLHGEAYRGHIFWDEIFVFPFFNITRPEISRSLLMYRYRRLNEARYAAHEAGYQGAMFPWQSGSNGREESQVIHLNPASGRWVPDHTYLQRHVNATIAYNVWHYFEITGDLEFLSFYGAEMLLEIAKFWASMVTFNEEKGRYEILDIVGPDEYHTHYPGSDQPGLKNNAYTNIMAVFCLIHALKAVKKLDKEIAKVLLEQLEIDKSQLKKWDEITHKMFVPFVGENKVIEQFEGFDQLEEVDWEKYHAEYGEVLRLDRIMEKEGDDVNKYRAVKQADVLMLFFLFSSDELCDMFSRMGYDFNPKIQIPETISYYQEITAHGSTLSKVVHSWVYARSRRKESWKNFKKALMSDFKDVQGGTTSEGIHLGAMAGSLDLIQRCYTGMDFREDCLFFNPRLPENVGKIQFRIRYRKHWLEITITQGEFEIRNRGGWGGQIHIMLVRQKISLKKGETKVLEYNHKKAKKKEPEN
ncbi:glycoside hydrolase family 65 protein [Litoribacter populi]|uniref:glycoside hydrolase family 65 protein n=1 Tax=Litoribacter populi TaxID=2598460 RepID=UPI00117ED09D|nr:glycosyl hydrolase family 65 protein [Litoribacter populi]